MKANGMMIPAPIYNILPIVYLLIGVTVPFVIENGLAYMSGVIFGVTSVIIMRLRMWI